MELGLNISVAPPPITSFSRGSLTNVPLASDNTDLQALLLKDVVSNMRVHARVFKHACAYAIRITKLASGLSE